MNVYIINGYPGSGKTTFEQNVQRILGDTNCKIYSTIDRVKEIAVECGWDGTKTPTNRKFLSDLKMLLTRWGEVPIKDIEKKINAFSEDLKYYIGSDEFGVVFVDCREPEEIDKLKQLFNAKTIFIDRPHYQRDTILNNSDKDVENYQYDQIISNDGSFFEFALKAADFAKPFLPAYRQGQVVIGLNGEIYS